MSISETYPLPPSADIETYRKVVARKIGAAVEDAMDREIKRYSESDDE